MAGELQPVESNAISHVGYDPASQTLTIRFKASGATHQYQGVPQDAYQALTSAESIGKYFQANIRPNFKSQRI